MEEVKVLALSCGTQIPAIRGDTFKIFTPGLIENAEHIHSITPITESYGSHARHKVDIYECSEQRAGRGKDPILVFLYGGGMTRGNRTIEAVPKGLVYHNLGTYFASRGLTTLVPDYRRVDSKRGGEGAVSICAERQPRIHELTDLQLYPSGGEDVALLLQWIQSSNLLANGHRDVYLLGNSAGAIHISTFLLDGQFSDQRKQYVEGSKGYLRGGLESVGIGKSLTLKGAIMLGLPSDFAGVSKERKEHSKVYYGSEDKAATLSPLGLLSVSIYCFPGPRNALLIISQAITATTSTPTLSHLAIPHLLVLTAEYDPPDEIIHPTEAFVKKFQDLFPTSSHALDYKVLKGHNHISPIAALMSGDEAGERWAEELVTWILGSEKVSVDAAAREILRGAKKKHTDAPPVNVTEGGKADRSHEHTATGTQKDHEVTDLNREGNVGNTGKGENKPKEIDPKEHFTPQDRS